MASFMFRFSTAVDAIKGFVAKPPSRRDALFILEDMDKYRNLHTGVAVVSFFVSAGFGVLAFFLITESVLWVGANKQAAMLLVSVSWVLIFPIWALTFLFIMALLGVMGIRDVRSVVRYSLLNLTLSQDQLHELHRILASRNWRHGRIFKSVIADLTKEQLGAEPA
jgi:hypothetical protein